MQDFGEKIEYYSHKEKSSLLFYIICIVIVLILFSIALLNTFVYMKVIVCGHSMDKTLYDGEIVTISKIAQPDYGDIIVISGEKSNGDWLIKRLIAKGGDKVRLLGGKVYLQKASESEFSLLEEDYINGVDCTYSNCSYVDEQDDVTYTIEEGQYFYMGDNRMNSLDSRGSFKTCSREQIVGVERAWLRFMEPVDRFFCKILGVDIKEGND